VVLIVATDEVVPGGVTDAGFAVQVGPEDTTGATAQESDSVPVNPLMGEIETVEVAD